MVALIRQAAAVLFAVVATAAPLFAGPDRREAGTPRAAAAVSPAESAPAPAPTPGADLRGMLESVFDKQLRSGDIAFGAADSVLYYHPVMATLSLEAFRRTGDLAFLQKAQEVLKAYFNYLLVNRDADRDLLIERRSFRDSAAPDDAEDPGFNALFALDMSSLSQICIELGMPVDALFWYRGMRVVSDRLAKTAYDPSESTFAVTFGSHAGNDPAPHVLSVLPVYFGLELGDEIPLKVIRERMLAADSTLPESPAKYLAWDFSPTERLTVPCVDRLLRAVLLLGALERNGLDADAARFAADISPKAAAELSGGAGADDPDLAGYLASVIASNGPFDAFPRLQGLAVLDELVFRKSLLEPNEVAALRRSTASVREFLERRSTASAPPAVTPAGADAAAADIRQVYFSISLLRDKWKQKTLFTDNDRSTITGLDLYASTAALFDDAVSILQTAENSLVEDEWRSEGFSLNATLEKSSVAPGEPIPIRLSVSSSRPVEIQSIRVLRQQTADIVMNSPSPVVVSPDEPVREFTYSYPAPRGAESVLFPFAFSVEVRFDGARHDRFNFRKAVFVTRPVTCAVRFPRGTTLSNGSVPIEILVTKHLPLATKIQAQWYSPAGLKPAEGRALEAVMPAATTEASMFINILVPNPCRPGSFPFTLKVFADGSEVGTVTSSLFKHYEWLFVGPFPGKRGALDARYPPEAELNLFDTYTGALGQLLWQPLPAKAYADDGRLSLKSILPDGTVGFLYTVIETAAPRTSTILFESASPAVLIINGEAVGRTAGGASRERFDVALKGGMNNILVKIHATADPTVFFQLGDEEDLMADEFNNNLWELVDGYQELLARGHERGKDADDTRRRVTLTFRYPNASSVAVVGSFNGWSPSNSSMRKNKYGEWEIGLFLAPGRYTYRFVVNDNIEMVDPVSPYTEPDGYGGQNSVLYVQ